MRHESLDQILTHATPLETSRPMSRRERLLRWADVLQREDGRVLQPLKFVEFYAPSERGRLRGEQTPLALAFADPVLQGAGLTGDTLQDIQEFFGLSDHEAHYLLCDCHWHGQMTGEAASRRIRAMARPSWISRVWSEMRLG